MTTEQERASKLARTASLFILAAIDKNVSDAGHTLGALINSLYKGNEEQTTKVAERAALLAVDIRELGRQQKADRTVMMFACLSTINNMLTELGRELFDEEKEEGDVGAKTNH